MIMLLDIYLITNSGSSGWFAAGFSKYINAILNWQNLSGAALEYKFHGPHQILKNGKMHNLC